MRVKLSDILDNMLLVLSIPTDYASSKANTATLII